MMTTTSWDAMLNGSALSQEIAKDECVEIATARLVHSCGSVSTVALWKERRADSKRWAFRVTADVTHCFHSKKAAIAAFPCLAAVAA
jgi:hypothetical protein